MKASASIKNLYKSGTGSVVVLTTDAPAEDLEKYIGKRLNLELTEPGKKRSLNANSYYHVLCSKIAAVLNCSLSEVCNRMIAEYGQIDTDMGCICMRDSIDWTRRENLHLRPTSKTQIMANGELYRCYYVMRGSHTYNTKEMARLIDGVVQEARDLGIETLPPAQLVALLKKAEEAERR